MRNTTCHRLLSEFTDMNVNILGRLNISTSKPRLISFKFNPCYKGCVNDLCCTEYYGMQPPSRPIYLENKAGNQFILSIFLWPPKSSLYSQFCLLECKLDQMSSIYKKITKLLHNCE